VRVVVTGGAGFIGANLCRGLLDAGHDAVVLDDFSTGRAANLAGLDVETHVGSILDTGDLDAAVAGAGAIVHLAARPSVARSLDDPMATHEANATGTLRVLEAARRHGNVHTLVASSSSVYGANPVLPKREDLATLPRSPYAASKLAAEGYALSYQSSFGLPVLAFRFFNVFGPLQPAGHAYAAVVPALLDAALSGRAFIIDGDGGQTRDFTFVDSLVAVLIDAVERRVCSEAPVNLAFGGRYSLLDVIARVEALLGHAVAVEHGPPRPGDVRHSQAESTALLELFADIVPVSFDDGLAATLAWFRAERASGDAAHDPTGGR
jgi:UDP-glucose 4-epimerase